MINFIKVLIVYIGRVNNGLTREPRNQDPELECKKVCTECFHLNCDPIFDEVSISLPQHCIEIHEDPALVKWDCEQGNHLHVNFGSLMALGMEEVIGIKYVHSVANGVDNSELQNYFNVL
jgi:hypothetical protein